MTGDLERRVAAPEPLAGGAEAGDDVEHRYDRGVISAVRTWKQAQARRPEDSPYRLPPSLLRAA